MFGRYGCTCDTDRAPAFTHRNRSIRVHRAVFSLYGVFRYAQDAYCAETGRAGSRVRSRPDPVVTKPDYFLDKSVSRGCVVAYYGRLPTPTARLLYVPVSGRRVNGTTYGFRGPASRILLGRDSTLSTPIGFSFTNWCIMASRQSLAGATGRMRVWQLTSNQLRVRRWG